MISETIWPPAKSKMFQDSSQEPVSFPSCWKKERTTIDNNTQTSETLTNETATQQPSDNMDVAVQTDVEQEDSRYRLVFDNSAELKDFLNRVEPMVTKALERNVQSHAFDGYKVQWEEETTNVNLIHTLQHPSFSTEFPCTGLSWNCTGSVVAVCYGKFDHDSWCDHKSAVCTWNIDRRSLDPNKPDIVAEIPTCLMSLSFHPSLPSIIAVGTFTGEIHILNSGLDGDQLVASSGYVELSHKEPIAQLEWISLEESKDYHLLSLGNDGKILLWKWGSMGKQKQSSELELVQGFCLKSASIPRNLRVAKVNTTSELGGTCLSFSSEDTNTFIVGCENGSLVKCSLDAIKHSQSDLSLITSDHDLPTLIRYAFKPHYGPVYSLSCAPFHRNLFLSCGLDTTARLYTLLESAPLLLLEPGKGYLFAASWSPTRPLVVALGTAIGQLLFYDLKFSHISPKLTLQVCDRKPVYCIAYNPHRPRLLATGDGTGVIKVFSLSSELTQQTNGEIDYLASLVSDAMSIVV